ncbi:MAG: hypothetical protein KDD53_09690, partial [Bdellovibrionales bacterium]|nr:hypothetical protein [Bdellovibrionales bacterium]
MGKRRFIILTSVGIVALSIATCPWLRSKFERNNFSNASIKSLNTEVASDQPETGAYQAKDQSEDKRVTTIGDKEAHTQTINSNFAPARSKHPQDLPIEVINTDDPFYLDRFDEMTDEELYELKKQNFDEYVYVMARRSKDFDPSLDIRDPKLSPEEVEKRRAKAREIVKEEIKQIIIANLSAEEGQEEDDNTPLSEQEEQKILEKINREAALKEW